MRAVVFHNADWPVAIVGGYRPGQTLRQVDEFETDEYADTMAPGHGESDMLALEVAWRLHQRVDGDAVTERCVALEIRSLCVGDAVAVDGRLYAAESFGWTPVEEVRA